MLILTVGGVAVKSVTYEISPFKNRTLIKKILKITVSTLQQAIKLEPVLISY